MIRVSGVPRFPSRVWAELSCESRPLPLSRGRPHMDGVELGGLWGRALGRDFVNLGACPRTCGLAWPPRCCHHNTPSSHHTLPALGHPTSLTRGSLSTQNQRTSFALIHSSFSLPTAGLAASGTPSLTFPSNFSVFRCLPGQSSVLDAFLSIFSLSPHRSPNLWV